MSDLLVINAKYNPYREKLSLSKRKKSRSRSSKIPKLTSKYSVYKNKIKMAKKTQEMKTQKKIVFNMTHSKYPIIEEIATKKFGFIVTRNLNVKWDIFWSDIVTFLPPSCPPDPKFRVFTVKLSAAWNSSRR